MQTESISFPQARDHSASSKHTFPLSMVVGPETKSHLVPTQRFSAANQAKVLRIPVPMADGRIVVRRVHQMMVQDQKAYAITGCLAGNASTFFWCDIHHHHHHHHCHCHHSTVRLLSTEWAVSRVQPQVQPAPKEHWAPPPPQPRRS